ncbi:kelch repeat-containing protein [Archangium sp.]|uniref:kelch repeat-containing protein n=1 Tax=Archangium sp. TaxID=1872627 RepID=UPI002D78742E|nr:kelch repeat-containing protein [Archangium sp.]
MGGLTWLALMCVWLGCSQGEELEAVGARAAEGGWVAVGHPRELREEAARETPPWGTAPRVSRPQPPARAAFVRAWQEAPSQERALLLARAYFPEFAGSPESEERRVPVNPEAALRVRLPATENGAVEVATRGYVFRARPRAPSGVAASRSTAGATFYGARHFWTAEGAQGLAREGLWLTQRAEEFVVMEAGGTPYRAAYEVEVPDGIQVVRDAGEYLEFLDGAEVPVVRLHYAVARDSAGRGRQGQVRLGGARPAGRGGPGNLQRLVLEGRTLKVEMEVGLEGLEGPVVVDPGWSATGSMATARYRQTSTLLPNGKVLVAAGNREGGRGVQIASTELYDPATGTWSSAGTLAHAREHHTATLLPNGRVLIAGGYTPSGRSSSVELYDPLTGTWSLTGSMSTARFGHTATLLPNGKVLVAGGSDGNGGALTDAELYEPATGTWSATGSMVKAVVSHTATLLNTGKVLVAGGYEGNYRVTAIAQLYDPATGTWSSTSAMLSARDYHTATLLPNGKVLVAGGSNGSYTTNTLAGAELYDPATGTWSATGAMAKPHQFHAAALLPNGQVLVGPGYMYTSSSGGAFLVNPEVYDPATGTWSTTGSMAVLRDDYSMTLLPDGAVLVAGGYSGPTATAELYSPVTGTWSTTGSLTAARSSHTTTLLPSGKVLVTGGDGASGPLTSAELYDPAAGTWSSAGALATARTRHTATLLSGGRVLVAGGHGASGPLLSAELYASSAGTWLSTGALATARSGHTATLLNTGKVLVAGGQSSSAPLAGAELYDPATGTFSGTGTLSTARADHTATLLPTGKVLLTGGAGSSGAVASAELYDPMAGTFRATGSLATARTRHLASLLPSGRVLVASGLGTAGRLASVEVYTPSTGSFSAVGALGAARADSTATLLPAGRVLAVGGSAATGALASAEVYEDTGASEAWRPVVTPPASLQSGWTLTVNGSGLRGISEASSGNTQGSATSYPLVSLVALEGGRRTPVSLQDFSSTSVVMRVPAVLDGYYLMSVTTNAIPGGAVVFVDGPPPAPALTAPAAFVNTHKPTIAGTAEAGSSVTVSLDGATVGTVTANASGAWSLTLTFPLDSGPYTATAIATDAAGNTGPASAPRSFTVDTVAPNAPVLTAPAALSSNVTPPISGTAEAGSSVTVTLDGTVVGTVTANTSGAWSLTPTSPLVQGAHTVTATATDAMGNTSAPSAPRGFTVDSVAPAAPVLTAPASVVNTATPTISGTAEAGSTVTVRLDGSVAGTVMADASGAWTFTVASPLAQGVHTVTATARDAVGNTGAPSATRGFRVVDSVDTGAPAAPVLTAPTAVVTPSMPVIAGTAEVGSTVTVLLDGEVVGQTIANGSAIWSFTPASPLMDRRYRATATATDVAGNTSPVSLPRDFVVDSVAPTPPEVLTPAAGATVSPLELSFSGSAEAGSTVTVLVDGLAVGMTLADQSSKWSVNSFHQLAQGQHTVSATARDGVGNVSQASAPISFTVEEPQSCGCASSPSGGTASLVGLLALWLWGRRGRLSSFGPGMRLPEGGEP